MDWTPALRSFCCGSASSSSSFPLDPLDGLAALSSGGSENTIRTRQYSTCAPSYNLGLWNLQPIPTLAILSLFHSHSTMLPRTSDRTQLTHFCLLSTMLLLFHLLLLLLSFPVFTTTHHLYTPLICFFSSNVQCSILNLRLSYLPSMPFPSRSVLIHSPSQLKRIFYTI